MNQDYLCPVCGFHMEEPPEDFNICPSCGTEFGFHDVNSSIERLRRNWVEAGLQWWSDFVPTPRGWDPFEQLRKLDNARPFDYLIPGTADDSWSGRMLNRSELGLPHDAATARLTSATLGPRWLELNRLVA